MQPASPPSSRDSEFRFRPAARQDLDYIRELCRRVFLSYGSYDRYVEEWFGSEDVSTWIAEAGGSPAGFFMLAFHREPRPSSELLAIAVSPGHQGRGLGSALLDRCLALAAESPLGVGEVRLSVAEGNARAQRMFARRGFRFLAEIGIYPAGQRALFMSKTWKPSGREESGT